MKHFGKNRFISFFVLLLVLTLALSMNSVFAADTAATGTDSTVQQESGEPPASKESDSAISEQRPEQNQEQKPEISASPENPTTPESPKNLGWVTDNNETRYYDTENHFVTGMNTIEGKKYYFNNDGILQSGILKIGKAFKYHDVTIRPNKKTGAITKKQYRRASYGPYNYKKYILVDISDQTLKYYVKGKVKLKSNVVTGGRGCGTPTGRFKLHHKARNVNLTGPGYVSHVNYWMPFIGQSYGMHDASWRSQFGGSIYKYNGSHGCVNMPRSKVSKLYKMVPNGTRVIIRK